MLEHLIEDSVVLKEDRIAVGVSGGADSMVLLWALLDKQKQVGFYLKVINVNHHLRGEESDSDTKFVKEFCEKKKIPYEIVDVDVKSLKADKKLTLEESARVARYDAFAKIMKTDKLNKLFLAHHKNDQVETILMHIFRGSGVAGASGIKQNDYVVRPLLNFDKNEILKIASEHGVKFVTDSSNSDNAFARNYVRNVVVPAIEKAYPNVVNSIFEFGKKCKEMQEFVQKNIKTEYFEENNDYIVLKDQAFLEHSVVVHEYVKQVFEKLKIFADIESKHYDMIFELQKCSVNKSVDLPHQIQAKRTYTGVKFCKKTSKKKTEKHHEFILGELDFEGYGKIVTKIVSPDEVVYGEGALFADYTKISNSAVWRIRNLGDTFAKLGTGSKKLNDYFTDKKIDFEKRDNLPILAFENLVLIVAENDVSENVKIDGQTDQIVKIEFLPNTNRWQFIKKLLIL